MSGPQKQILTPYPRKTPLFGHSSLSWKFLLSVPPSSLPSLFLPAWWRPTLTWQFPSKKQIHVVSLSDWQPGYPFLYQKTWKHAPVQGCSSPFGRHTHKFKTHAPVQGYLSLLRRAIHVFRPPSSGGCRSSNQTLPLLLHAAICQYMYCTFHRHP